MNTSKTNSKLGNVGSLIVLGSIALGAVACTVDTSADPVDDGVGQTEDALQGGTNDKIAICHFTNSASNPYNVLEVSPRALPQHEAHGDFAYGNCCVDADCPAVDACTPGVCNQGTCNVATTCDDNAACSSESGSCVCNEGYSGDGETCAPVSTSPCQQIILSSPGCFWMENYSGNYCWVHPEWIDEYTEEQCFDANACGSGGGCYKWDTSAY